MKRTDITDLFPEATKEQIDKLMGINGADINGAKGETETLKTQLAEARAELEKFSGAGDQLKEAQDALAAARSEIATMKAREEIRVVREKVATDKAVPVGLLKGETEEECVTEADALLAFAKSSKYPTIPDGGETRTPSNPGTRDKFADWAKDNL